MLGKRISYSKSNMKLINKNNGYVLLSTVLQKVVKKNQIYMRNVTKGKMGCSSTRLGRFLLNV